MTGKDKRKRLKKGSGRRNTPRDLEVAGTLGWRPPVEKGPPRRPTPEEMHGNNNAAVEYAMLLFSLRSWMPLFEHDLEEMNRGKVGRPYDFSDALIIWMMEVMQITSGSFRFVAGMCGSLLSLLGVEAPSYSRLQERGTRIAEGTTAREGVLSLKVCPNLCGRVRRVGIDSSGLNLSATSLWRRRKWETGPKNRGWLKIHVLCDVDTGEVIAYALTDDSVGDQPLLKLLVGLAEAEGHRFGTVFADGAYASNGNWIFLCRENGYRFVTSFRSDTVPANNGCVARGEAARLWCSLPYDEWVRISGYGTRWKCECVFSDLKRMLGETVRARTKAGMIAEVEFKIRVFNGYKAVRAGIIGISGNGVALV